jgi:hypothetical protein
MTEYVRIPLSTATYVATALESSCDLGDRYNAEQIREAIRDEYGDVVEDLGQGRFALLGCGHAVRIYDNQKERPELGGVWGCTRHIDVEPPNVLVHKVIALIHHPYQWSL